MPLDASLPPQQLQVDLGRRVQHLRLSRRLSQGHVAERAGISERSLRNLEGGKGSTLETLLRVFGVLELLPVLDQLLPDGPADAPHRPRGLRDERLHPADRA